LYLITYFFGNVIGSRFGPLALERFDWSLGGRWQYGHAPTC